MHSDPGGTHRIHQARDPADPFDIRHLGPDAIPRKTRWKWYGEKWATAAGAREKSSSRCPWMSEDQFGEVPGPVTGIRVAAVGEILVDDVDVNTGGGDQPRRTRL